MTTRQKVLDILVREADLDGLVLVTEAEVGAELGIHQTSVGKHIHALAADGVLTIEPRTWANGKINALHLNESALA